MKNVLSKSRFGRPQGKGAFGTDHPHSYFSSFLSTKLFIFASL